MRPGALAFHLAVAAASALGVAVLAAAPRPSSSSDTLTCSPAAVSRGLARSHAVKVRTEALQAAGRLVRGDDSGLYLYETTHGQTWMPAANDLWSLAVVEAEQEGQMYGAPQGLGVRRGDVVLDIGAHVGLFTRAALDAGASKVITMEVTPKSTQALRRNLATAIADGRVVVLEKGAWFEDATLPLVVNERCSVCNRVSHPWMQATVDVPLTTIDQVVEQLHLTRVDFIKLDIENAEANALRGASKTLARYHPRLAVALENAKDRVGYGREVLQVVRNIHPGYRYVCGAMTPPAGATPALPEVLHFQP